MLISTSDRLEAVYASHQTIGLGNETLISISLAVGCMISLLLIAFNLYGLGKSTT